jgi:hypothetical protein
MICQGGCYCGEIRYELHLDSPDDARTSLCHCSSCKVVLRLAMSPKMSAKHWLLHHYFYRNSLELHLVSQLKCRRMPFAWLEGIRRNTWAIMERQLCIASSAAHVARGFSSMGYVCGLLPMLMANHRSCRRQLQNIDILWRELWTTRTNFLPRGNSFARIGMIGCPKYLVSI